MSEKVSFANDIAPVFKQFVGQMRWRFNLTDYDDVRENADLIYSYIKLPNPQMPPAPFPPLSAEQIHAFKWWKDNGFPP